MTVLIGCLLGYVGWTLLLLLGIGTWRVSDVLRGKKRPNEFPSGTPHGSDLYWRLNRAHLNAVENAPLFAAVILSAVALNVTPEGLQVAAVVYLCARVGQSIAHIASGRSLVVNIRFSFFLAQAAMLSYFLMVLAGAVLRSGS